MEVVFLLGQMIFMSVVSTNNNNNHEVVNNLIITIIMTIIIVVVNLIMDVIKPNNSASISDALHDVLPALKVETDDVQTAGDSTSVGW